MTTIQEQVQKLEKQIAILKKEAEKVQKQIKRDKQKKTTKAKGNSTGVARGAPVKKQTEAQERRRLLQQQRQLQERRQRQQQEFFIANNNLMSFDKLYDGCLLYTSPSPRDS